MRARARGIAGGLALATALAGSIAWAAQQPETPPPTPPQPAPDAKVILEAACTACHGLDFITSKRKSHDDWDATVHRMMDKGADLDADAATLVIDYLAKTYPREEPPAASPP